MRKKNFLTAAVAVAALSASSAFAGDMEKCRIVDGDGKGLIKKHKADCASKNSSCAGHNQAHDPEAWIYVPKGHCEVINKYHNDVPQNVKDKIEKS